MIRVKICGMASSEDVTTCSEAGADALGFIFAASSRRLSTDEAEALTAAVPPFVTTVGVFANDSAEVVRDALARCRLDVLQFSGDETPEFRGSFGKPTILAARGRTFSTEQLKRANAIAVLIDSWLPGQYGGTGKVVDAATVARERAACAGAYIILAGGLGPANVSAIIRASKPDAVDARTALERGARKDPTLVQSFVAAAREALQ